MSLIFDDDQGIFTDPKDPEWFMPILISVNLVIDNVELHRILYLLDEDSQDIVRYTWKGDYWSEKLVIVRSSKRNDDMRHQKNAMLGYVGGEKPPRPCVSCKKRCAFDECRVNRIWPGPYRCTSCMFKGEKCSLAKVLQSDGHYLKLSESERVISSNEHQDENSDDDCIYTRYLSRAESLFAKVKIPSWAENPEPNEFDAVIADIMKLCLSARDTDGKRRDLLTGARSKNSLSTHEASDDTEDRGSNLARKQENRTVTEAATLLRSAEQKLSTLKFPMDDNEELQRLINEMHHTRITINIMMRTIKRGQNRPN